MENEHLGQILDINKSKEGIETCVVGENNVTELDARKVTAMLKLKIEKIRTVHKLQTEFFYKSS